MKILKKVFHEHELNPVYKPNSNKTLKTVFINTNLSTKYGEVVKVIHALKEISAEPIILQIDD
jgi:biopolymer transport protein ExbD